MNYSYITWSWGRVYYKNTVFINYRSAILTPLKCKLNNLASLLQYYSIPTSDHLQSHFIINFIFFSSKHTLFNCAYTERLHSVSFNPFQISTSSACCTRSVLLACPFHHHLCKKLYTWTPPHRFH